MADHDQTTSRKRHGSPLLDAATAAQRPRQQPSPANAAAAASRSTHEPDLPDSPLHLLRVRCGIPDWANEGFLGFNLQQAISNNIKWAMIANFKFDLPWLFTAAPPLKSAEQLVIVHGMGSNRQFTLLGDLENAGLTERTFLHMPPVPQWGTHHTKAFFLQYERGLRVIIFTANCVYHDCNNKTQGAFIQDFPLKDSQSSPSSPFEQDLLDYLEALHFPSAVARHTASIVSLHDFTASRAHLIASVPGIFHGLKINSFGHLKLRSFLHNESHGFPKECIGSPLAFNFSSIGKLAPRWMEAIQESFSSGKANNPSKTPLGRPRSVTRGLSLVWPTVDEVKNSLEGWFAGGSIPANTNNVLKPILKPLYCKWGSSHAPTARQRAMPHLKSYVRYLPTNPQSPLDSEVELAYACFTSHNLSKAAWGEEQKSAMNNNRDQIKILSYELGALVTPSTELRYRTSRWYGFSATDASKIAGPMEGVTANATRVRLIQWRNGTPQHAALQNDVLTVPVPIPYALPPEPYSVSRTAADEPWSLLETTMVREGIDSLGFGYPGRGQTYGIESDALEWSEIVDGVAGGGGE